MRAHPAVWILRLAWITLPLTVGDAFGRALDGRVTSLVVVAAALAWAGWAAVLVASLLPHPVTLTIVRVLAPAAPVVALALTLVRGTDGSSAGTGALGLLGIVSSLVAAAAALSAFTADDYVNAASYGDERRFALRTPTSFLIGPVPVFWVALVGGLSVGPLLLGAHVWIAGAAVTLVGAVAAPFAIKAFHALSRRWLVFVPAGATAIDHLTLVDPVLFPARRIVAFGPALEGTTATDLTSNAPGLVLEIAFDTPIEIAARTSRDDGELQLARAVLLSVGRPGAVMSEAARRGIVTG
ncbi:MAG: hypothetical protein U0Q22_16855 [Acidimicrobiales bacterium]